MTHTGESAADEKTRACPTCRMLISILATRCRFCGAEVGRPRIETRSLTIDDLGGESVQHYVPSSNVMEALEAFRADEVLSDTDKKSPKGRKTPIPGKKVGEGLPQLDEAGRALADIRKGGRAKRLYGQGRGTGKKVAGAPKPWAKYGIIAVAVVVGAVVLYFGGGAAISFVRSMGADETSTDVKLNPAKRLLRDNAPVDKILAAAAKAMQDSNTPDNQAILDEARKRMAEEITGLLNAPQGKWTEQKLRQAAQLAEMANRADPNETFRNLKSEADTESSMYYMHLSDIKQGDTGEASAVFKLSSGTEVTVKKDEILNGRFKVLAIAKDSVRLADQSRDNRTVSYDRFGGIQ